MGLGPRVRPGPGGQGVKPLVRACEKLAPDMSGIKIR
jgi:hypothetical protein